MEAKLSHNDLDKQMAHTKLCIEDITKELMLKASIKDLCQLLDQKVNVNDLNHTLALV